MHEDTNDGISLVEEVNRAAEVGVLLGDLENTVDDVYGMLEEEYVRGSAAALASSKMRRLGYELVWREVQKDFLERARPTALWRHLALYVDWPGRYLGRRGRARMDEWWTTCGLGLALVTATFVIMRQWEPAVISLGVRLVGSVGAGGPTVMQTSDQGTFGMTRNLVHSLLSCLAGHGADLIVATAASAALVLEGRPLWALATSGAATLAAFGTMARIAAERSGVKITRSRVERFARNGSLLVSLVVLAWTKSGEMVSTVPAFAILVGGLGGYGLAELVRVLVVIGSDPTPAKSVSVTVDREGGIRMSALVEGTRASGSPYAHTTA